MKLDIMMREAHPRACGGRATILKGIVALGGVMASIGAVPLQGADTAFHYVFASDAPERDSGPDQRALTFGRQVEFLEATAGRSTGGIKVSPSLDGRAYFEDATVGETSVLHRLLSSKWTLGFWIKLDELSDRSQMLFCVQPAGDSHSDLNIQLQPEKDTDGTGFIVLTDASGIPRAKSPVLDWKVGVWYYVAIVSDPTESTAHFTLYRGENEAGDLSEIHTGPSSPLVAQKKEGARVFQFANFWGNFGKDALRGVMGNARLTWEAKGEQEISKDFHEEVKL